MYKAKYDGATPTMQSFGDMAAVNLFAGAVEQNGGDTTPAKPSRRCRA